MKSLKYSWLISPRLDFLFFIGAPLLIIPGFQLLSSFVSVAAIKLGVMGISATGHHLPGFIRAYTDKSIFNQFKLRLILVPTLFILMALSAGIFKLTFVFWILIVWGTWHGAMQILGFLRIYDAKAGFQSQSTARLDFWMCLTWFVQVVFWSTGKKMTIFSSFYMGGGPLLPATWIRALETGWLVLTAAVTAAFLHRFLDNWFRHGYLNLPKLLCMVASFGFWAYCMISIQHLIIGLVLWEIFHDAQYNVFVWNYNRNRVAKDFSQSRIERFLFRTDWRKTAFYALCIAAYGSFGLLMQDALGIYQSVASADSMLFQIGNVFAASAMMHFYLDGFIWKIRDGKVRKDLGLETTESFKKRPIGVHWALVGLLMIVAGGMGFSEYFQWNKAQVPYRSNNLVDLVPKSGYANFMKASGFRSEGLADSAILYYERAIRFDADYEFSHLFIGDLKSRGGDLEGAIPHYEIAARLEPEDMVIKGNLAALYSQTGRYDRAEKEYRGLLASDSLNPEHAYQLAWSLLQMKKGQAAKPYLELTLRLNPDQPKALNYLGMVEHSAGNLDKARRLYEHSLELDTAYTHARENLAALKTPGP